MSGRAWTDKLVGQVVGGRYRLDRVIGLGGMGAVFRAVHAQLGRPVAVKVLTPRLAGDDNALLRFQREARSASAVGGSGVVAVIDFDVDPAWGPFLVMEFLEGESLSELLARKGRLTSAETVGIMMPVLGTLAAVHAQGIIHRDLKPGNIFLAAVGGGKVVVKVLDFGVARLLNPDDGANLTRPGTVLGTPSYMPPEQVRGRSDLDARADVYAAGAILYACLSARKPYDGTANEVLAALLAGPPAPLRSVCPGLPGPLYTVVETAMAHDRERRFQGAAAMLEALRAVRISLPAAGAVRPPVSGSPSVPAPPSATPSRPSPVLDAGAPTVGMPPGRQPVGTPSRIRRVSIPSRAVVAGVQEVAAAQHRPAPPPARNGKAVWWAMAAGGLVFLAVGSVLLGRHTAGDASGGGAADGDIPVERPHPGSPEATAGSGGSPASPSAAPGPAPLASPPASARPATRPEVPDSRDVLEVLKTRLAEARAARDAGDPAGAIARYASVFSVVMQTVARPTGAAARSAVDASIEAARAAILAIRPPPDTQDLDDPSWLTEHAGYEAAIVICGGPTVLGGDAARLCLGRCFAGVFEAAAEVALEAARDAGADRSPVGAFARAMLDTALKDYEEVVAGGGPAEDPCRTDARAGLERVRATIDAAR